MAGETTKSRRGRMPWLLIGVGLAIAAALAFFLLRGGGETAPYRTAEIERGEIVRAVTATGQLQPVVAVEVGSTVSGPVETVEVDFNAQVRKGQVLARIDPETFEQRVRQLQAGVDQARASANQARAELQRYETLATEGFASDQLLLQQRTELERAQASVALAEAQLATARVDLERTVIRSPVDGVVVDRTVDPGQTVAASFTAPKLFIIAQDLSQLEARITVDEADIGVVEEGLPVRFTVDAFPDETFNGAVSQVRKQGVANSGVVSYSVIVLAPNRGGRLLPGMTANAEIVVEEKPTALRVPNAALRFTPGDPALAAQAKELGAGGAAKGGQGKGSGGQRGAQFEQMAERLKLTPAQREQAQAAMENARAGAGPFPGPDADEGARRAFAGKMRAASQKALEPILTAEQKIVLQQIQAERRGGGATRSAVLWVLRDGRPTPVTVQLGVAADAYTEIVSGLEEGEDVIIGGGPEAPAQKGGNPLGGGGPRVRGI